MLDKQMKLEKEIKQINGGQELTPEEVLNNMNTHFSDWFSDVKQNFAQMFEPMNQGIQAADDELIAEELKFFVHCDLCQTIVEQITEFTRYKLGKQLVQRFFFSHCSELLNTQTCGELVRLYTELVDANIYEVVFNTKFLCGYWIPICEDGSEIKELKSEDYVKQILFDKPQFLQEDDFLDKLYEQIDLEIEQGIEQKTYKVMQISDWHVDFRYIEGSNRECKETICCQEVSGIPQKQVDKARKYGELTCDLPYQSAQKQIEWLSQYESDIDMIIWTGDSISHDLTFIEHKDVIDTLRNLTKLIKQYFPEVQVVPALGNHDFHPPNYQSFNVSFSSHLQDIADIWDIYLDEDASLKFKEYGYYKIDFPQKLQEKQKAFVIVLNTQTCYIYNFGLFNESNDAASQLYWVKQQLDFAEKNDQVVIIIGHIPPGDYGCIQKWAVRFNALMERYQHIIRFQAFGHDHRELFEVARSFSTNKPISVNHVSGSLGTFMKVNPSVRIYTMHSKYHIPLDFKVLEYNIEEANLIEKGQDPQFSEYSFLKRDFKMKNFSPSEFLRLSDRFYLNPDDALQYHKYYWKNGPDGNIDNCDENCRKSLHCDSQYAVNEHKINCYNSEINRDHILQYALGQILDPWVETVNYETQPQEKLQ